MRPFAVLIVVALALLLTSVTAQAQVSVVREGDENPALTIAKSTFWGGVTGLLLGGATALVSDDNEGDIIKWFFVGGTFAGFGFGVYHVLNRPQPSTGLIDVGDDGWAVRRPTMEVAPRAHNASPTYRITLVTYGF